MKKLIFIFIALIVLNFQDSLADCVICIDGPAENWGYCYQFSLCDQYCTASAPYTCDGQSSFEASLCPPGC
jgi:hypothetical protein